MIKSASVNLTTRMELAVSSTTVVTYPQMPVLLMAMVTCPSFNSSPFCTLSNVGAASLIHKSCLGFVKTPMLALVALAVADAPRIGRLMAKLGYPGYLAETGEVDGICEASVCKERREGMWGSLVIMRE